MSAVVLAMSAQLIDGRIAAVVDATEPEVTAADEVPRVLAGEPPRHLVDPAVLAITA